MDKNYKKILNQINTYEDILLQQILPTATFNDIFLRVLSLRKQYQFEDYTGKYVEVSQFLNYIKLLLIQREKYMSNATFDSVLKYLTSIHKKFESQDAQYVFINREIQYLDEIATSMTNKTHSMTTRRLNEIGKKKAELQKQIDLTK